MHPGPSKPLDLRSLVTTVGMAADLWPLGWLWSRSVQFRVQPKQEETTLWNGPAEEQGSLHNKALLMTCRFISCSFPAISVLYLICLFIYWSAYSIPVQITIQRLITQQSSENWYIMRRRGMCWGLHQCCQECRDILGFQTTQVALTSVTPTTSWTAVAQFWPKSAPQSSAIWVISQFLHSPYAQEASPVQLFRAGMLDTEHHTHWRAVKAD